MARLNTGFSAKGQGQLFTGNESPFWMHTNYRGRLDEKSHLFGLLTSTAKIDLNSESYAEFGVGAFYKDGYSDGFKLDEVYFNICVFKIWCSNW